MRQCAIALALITLITSACEGGDSSTNGPTTTATIEPANAESICSASYRPAGRVQSPDLVEISGIAANRWNRHIAEIIWAHNDSGDSARFFALDINGEHRDVFNLVGAEAVDIEDMAVGPGPNSSISYVYLADIGDNDAKRAEVVVYRVPEPTVTYDSPDIPTAEGPAASGTPAYPDITNYDILRLRYPDGPQDAETLIVDPLTDDLLIVTKNIATGVSQVFRGDSYVPDGEPQTLEPAGEIDFAALRPQIVVPEGAPPLANGLRHIPTGGDVSPDGTLVAIRTYGAVFIWERPEGGRLAEAFENEPCQAPSVVEQQGEAIAFNATGTGYITISEGAKPPINEFVVE